MVANGLDNLRSEYIVLYDPAYEEEIESRLREEYLESSLLGKGGVIIKSLGHAAAKRYRYAKARYQVGMYESLGIDYETSEKALDSSMSYIAGEVVIGSLAKGYQWTKSLKARSKKISTFAKGTGKAGDSLTKIDDVPSGSFGKNTVGAAEKYVPKNIKMVNDKYLKRNGIDAHALKQEFVGRKNMSHYDLYVDKDTKMLWIFRKGGIGEPMATYEYLK
ncbi:MAG: polymorphic toxin type 33 domain-containing protein [Clostridia bacterium]|nr:polymorphic toxin type 33 domain-containing protein [Clostridia bacterium]